MLQTIVNHKFNKLIVKTYHRTHKLIAKTYCKFNIRNNSTCIEITLRQINASQSNTQIQKKTK